jgi:hypothetical protein
MRSFYSRLPPYWPSQPSAVFILVHLHLVWLSVSPRYSDLSSRADAALRYIRVLADDLSCDVLHGTGVPFAISESAEKR